MRDNARLSCGKDNVEHGFFTGPTQKVLNVGDGKIITKKMKVCDRENVMFELKFSLFSRDFAISNTKNFWGVTGKKNHPVCSRSV